MSHPLYLAPLPIWKNSLYPFYFMPTFKKPYAPLKKRGLYQGISYTKNMVY